MDKIVSYVKNVQGHLFIEIKNLYFAEDRTQDHETATIPLNHNGRLKKNINKTHKHKVGRRTEVP